MTRPTLAAVARHARVSVPTVSKVIHARPDVSPATRAAVLRSLDLLGYWRSGDVAAPPSRVCELVLVDIGPPWSATLLAAFHQAAAPRDLRLGVSVLADPADTERWLAATLTARPLGVVLVFAGLPADAHHRLRAAGIRVVAVGGGEPPPPGVPAVGVADADAARQATERLLALGHRAIAVISGEPGRRYSEQRVAGYRAALAGHGLVAPPEYLRSGPLSVASGHRAALALLDLPAPPTAVVAGNDQVALGVYRAVRERGGRVPADLSVIGIDDQPEARWLDPPLTTMRQPVDAVAAAALDLIGDPNPTASPPAIPLTLVERASTAPPADPGTAPR